MADATVVTVTTDPTLLYQSNGPQVETLMIDVTAGSTITIGGRHVADGAGPQMAVSTQAITLQINEDAIYAVAASGTATVAIASWLSGPNP